MIQELIEVYNKEGRLIGFVSPDNLIGKDFYEAMKGVEDTLNKLIEECQKEGK